MMGTTNIKSPYGLTKKRLSTDKDNSKELYLIIYNNRNKYAAKLNNTNI